MSDTEKIHISVRDIKKDNWYDELFELLGKLEMQLIESGALKLKPDSATPLYIQLANKIQSAVDSGLLKPGDAVPSERVLVDALDISRGTARKAFQMLLEEGVLNRNQGSGTFVAFKIEQSSEQLESFTEMVRSMGYTPESEIVGYLRRSPTKDEVSALSLDEGEDVVELKRVRKANGIAISLQIAILSFRLLPSLTNFEGSLYTYLKLHGVNVARATQRFNGVIADKSISTHLNIIENEPLLLVTRIAYTDNDKPVELTSTWCLNDYYNFSINLNK